MNKDIAVQEESALAAPVEFIDVAGFDQLGPEDFSLPRLILVQAQHVHDGAEKHVGEYYRTDTNEHIEYPRVLLIGIAKSRIMFEESTFSRDSDPLCRSDDGFKPRMEHIGTGIQGVVIPESCLACPFSDWNADTPPPCQLADNWAALTDEGEPVIFRLKGAGAKVSKQLKNVVRISRARKRPTYIELGSVREVGDRGNYLVPSFQIVREAPPEEMLFMASELAGVNLAARAASEDNFDQTNGNVDTTVDVAYQPEPEEDDDTPF